MRKKTYFFLLFFLIICTEGFTQNYVSTYSGKINAGFNNGAINVATFNSPFGLCIDKYDNLYLADAGNNCIRKIDAITGTVSTLAGTGVAGWKDGTASVAKFNSPADLCIDDSGNVYVSDFLNQRIRKISIDGYVTTVAGTGSIGLINGDHTIAKFNYPRGICRDKSGNLYIADSWNHRIRKIDTLGIVSTYAGGGTAMGVGSTGSLKDSTDINARFFTPAGLSIDQHGNIYVADAYNHRIRKIDTTGIVTTVAGSGLSGVGKGGFMDGTIDLAILNTPTEVFADTSADELYIGDTFNNRVRKINIAAGMVSTFAGNGLASYIDSLDTLASFNYPRGVVVSNISTKKVFVNDYSNNAIRLIKQKVINTMVNYIPEYSINIFPNPSESIFTVNLVDEYFTRIEILSILGKSIKILSFNSVSTAIIDLLDLPRGTYFLIIGNSSVNFRSKKIILK